MNWVHLMLSALRALSTGTAKAAALLLLLQAPGAAQTRIAQFVITPTQLSFTAIDPDQGGPAPQSTAATFRLLGPNVQSPWTLYVESESASMSGCGSIPASALKVTCTSASHDSGNNSGKAYCAASPVAVSTSRAVAAYGNQGNRDHNVRVDLQVTMADSWRYQAALSPSCTISLRYTVDAP